MAPDFVVRVGFWLVSLSDTQTCGAKLVQRQSR